MAASKGFTTAIQTKIYHDAAYLTGTIDYAAVHGIAAASNEVKHSREIGDIAQEANIFEFIEFGKSTQTRVAGPASLGDFAFTFAADMSDAKHSALVNADPGDACVVVIETTTASDEITAFYLRGTIASVSVTNPAGDVRQSVVGVALDTKPARVDNA